MAIRPILIDPESPFLGENCALCKEPFAPEEGIVVCPDDATRHHVACWMANNNKCTAYGCTGSGRPITRAQALEQGETEIYDSPDEVEEQDPDEGVVDQGIIEGVVEPRRRVRPISAPTTQRSKVRTMPSSSFGCAQGCLILAIAIAIVIISISCFGLWAIADYIMIEVLQWEYRAPLSFLIEAPAHISSLLLLISI